MMSDERFFNQVKATMAGYSPEVPEVVYGAMRRKLWWSNFTRLSATRLNVWYLALALGAGVAGAAHFFGSSAHAERPGNYGGDQNWAVSVANTANQTQHSSNEAASSSSTCASSCSASKSCSEAGHASAKSTGGSSSGHSSQAAESSTATETMTAGEYQTETTEAIAQVENNESQEQTSENPTVSNETTSLSGKKKLKVSVFKNRNQETTEKK